jgi:AcrR family transcriptional regulator
MSKSKSVFITPRDSRLRFTKQSLFDAFLKLLETKSVSEITVSEICELAEVSRKTFYKYYSDPFALLLAMQDDLFIGLLQRLGTLEADIFTIVPELIHFVGDHRVLVRASLANRGEGNFVDRVIDQFYLSYADDWQKINPQLSDTDVRFLFQYVTSGLAGIIQLWLLKLPEMDTEEIIARADFLMRLSTP